MASMGGSENVLNFVGEVGGAFFWRKGPKLCSDVQGEGTKVIKVQLIH